MKNSWLASLPEESLRLLEPSLRQIALSAHQLIAEPGEIPDTVVFPITTVCSVVVTMEDGKSVESAAIGSEGFAPPAAALGYASRNARTVCQISGDAYAIDVARFREAVLHNRALREAAEEFVGSTMDALMQGAACGAAHTLSQRCARWLLTLHERIGSAKLKMTHQALADALGASRPRISEVLAQMQKERLVSLHRASLWVANPVALQLVACECYAAGRAQPEATAV